MSSLKFAVVREDPLTEQAIIELIKPKNVLMIASGGCIALSLKALFSEVNFTLFDINPNQIQLVKNKVQALKKRNENVFYKLFNIEEDNRDSLNGSGEFESLFRSLKNFINELILPAQVIKNLFLSDEVTAQRLINILIGSKYWPVAFDLHFSDSLLISMFGSDAVQHGVRGTYPKYFQSILENGLKRSDYKNNYFLQHILLGYYLGDSNSWPYYLTCDNRNIEFEYINTNLLAIEGLDKFQLISLSNIFDWMSETEVLKQLEHLNKNLQPESYVIFRQLNNEKDYTSKTSGFKANDALSKELLAKDRSLFYNKINILQKI